MSRKGNPGAAFSSGLPTHQQQQPPATAGGGVGSSGAFPPSQTSSKQSSVGTTSNTASLGASITSLSSAQQPPAPPISVVTSTNSAYAMINGIQLIRCLLPSVSERSCTVPVDASPNLQILEDHGRFELNCLFYASADVSGSGTPFIGELIVDERITIYLGKLPDPAFHVTSSRGLPSTQPSQKEATSSTRPAPKGRGRSQRQRHAQKQTSVIPESPSPAKPEHNSARVQMPMCVARYVPEHPKTLALRVTHCVQEHYRHPEESALLEECQLLLLDRFVFGKYPEGLVPISVLQRNVEQLDVYRRVILEHYQGRWPIFLQQQVDELVIYPTAGAESRVGLKDREHAIATMLEDPFRTGRDAAAVAAAGGAVVVANEEGEEQGRSDEKPSLLAPTAGGGGVATGSDRPPTDESGADESPATASLAVERQLKTEAERVIVTAMMEFLQAHGDVPYTELLAFLEKIPPFSRTLVPNHQYLYRFFNSHRDDFWITYDPIHSTRVGLVKPPTTSLTKSKEEEK